MEEQRLVALVAEAAHPLTGDARAYDPLLEMIGDARFVLIGEASHGTHEFYEQRAAITQRLIEERGFNIIAVEADWPDAYRVNRYVRGQGDDASAQEALGDFTRFPRWMWRNRVVDAFIEWLRAHNQGRADEQQVGFYGIDLYSMYSSMVAVQEYLDEVDPEAAERARYRYSCFDAFGENPQAYGYAASLGISQDCEDEAVRQLTEMRRAIGERSSHDGAGAMDDYFYAEQNARLVKNAEEYYRSMFRGSTLSWNLRDQHMAETISELVAHFERSGIEPRVVLWAHNSHLGDARYTESGRRGQLNVGQLVRERYGKQACLIGFSTYTGTVTAADDWDEPARRKRVRPGLPESDNALFHRTGIPAFYLTFREGGPLVEGLRRPRLQRAIGVIYRPESERISHYYHAQLSDQFDAMIHIDESQALEPLDRAPAWASHDELPDTYPFGL